MRTLLIISVLSLAMVSCGGSSSSTRRTMDVGPEAGAGGEDVVTPTGGNTETGGASGETGGTGGYDPSGGTGNDVATGGQDVGTGGDATGGQGLGGEPVGTGGEPAGTGGEATGGTGNVGGSCEPWDCTNIAIQLAGWDAASGDPIPEACGLVQDPCTGMMVDCGGCGDFQDCGGDTLLPSGETSPGVESICGGNCIETYVENVCSGDYSTVIACLYDSQVPPEPDCQPGLSSGSWHFWCC